MNSNTKDASEFAESGFSILVVLAKFACGSGLIITLATALRPIATYWWVADLFCQFAVQYVVLLIPIIALVAAVRMWKYLALFVVVLSINAFLIWPYVAGSHSFRKSDQVRVLTQNVLTSNRQFQLMVDLIEHEDPDVVILLEIDQGWMDELKSIHTTYPHRKHMVHSGNFGIAIFSKEPWNECRIELGSSSRIPSIVADYDRFQLIGVHPVPPVSAAAAASRNQQLMEVAKLRDANKLSILAGDFNLTPWSPWFQKILDTGYSDPGRWHGLEPTWYCFPTWLGGVKIDHALISDLNRVIEIRIGPDVQSDHRATILDFNR